MVAKLLSCQDIIDKRCDLWYQNKNIKLDRKYREAVAEKIIDESPQGEKLRSEINAEPSLLIEMVFTIVDKEKQTVPFFLNEVQQTFLNRLKKAIADYEAGKINFIRFLILKGRQQGFTSVITAYQLACTITKQNFVGMTVSHEDDSTNSIFEDKARYMYDHLPEEIKPVEKYNNRRELLFEKLNSKWRIATAGNKDIGRSKTMNFFHASEAAFWKSIQDILSGLGQAITKDSIIILETTANGYNEFKEYWDDAITGQNNFIPLFFEWWHTPEYRLEFENELIESAFKKAVIDGYGYKGVSADFFEKLNTLRKSKNLDWQQLYWAFNKKLELKDKFEQEYPCTPKEAFLHTGRPYFDLSKIDNLIISLDKIKPARIEKGGSVSIWETPIKDELYCIGGDPAEGTEDGDSSSAIIYKLSDWSQVAKIHGLFAPDRFGNILVDFALKYNNAYIIIENNNHGWSVLNTAYIQRKYKNIHFSTIQKSKNDKETKKMGWTTTEASKYLMLDELDAAIRNDELIIRDKDFLEQLREVVYDETGKVSITGKDMVVANALAWQGRKYIKRNIATVGNYSNFGRKGRR
ncbi:MAG: hypothetical protein MI740_10430 [Halanaerobiales bacterium]|nr:hypothetical protein [Halanaerobiales bacterium]